MNLAEVHTQSAHGSSHACFSILPTPVRLGKYGIAVFINIHARHGYRTFPSKAHSGTVIPSAHAQCHGRYFKCACAK